MIINVTYDASVAGAPAGYKQAVEAAVQYWESAISTNITVNIDFGWGEVGGQTMDPGALGESSANLTTATVQGVQNALLNSGSTDPGAIAGYLSNEAATYAEATAQTGNSATINPATGTGDGVFVLTLAQVQALNFANQYNFPANTVDGYVGLSSTADFTYDPNNRAVAGAYDAIGTLEHEISEVLGRSDGLGALLSDGTPSYSLLDYYRYTATGQPTLSPGDGSFSFDGGRDLLYPFNNPSDGGDAGDWSSSVTNDAFDAYATPGVALTVSPVDLRIMEALGYKTSAPQDVIGSSDIVTGVSPNGTVTNNGGVLRVQATALGADAVGLYSANLNFNNASTIQVISANTDAWGTFATGSSFTFVNQAGASLSVTAAHQAMGALFYSGGAFTNAGQITVTGATAYGEVGATSFNNSGTLAVVATGSGAKGIAVDIANPWGLSFTNSGTITADYAFLVDEHTNVITIPGGQSPTSLNTVSINNSGHINGIISLTDVIGQITNTGSITGAIDFGGFNSTYNGAGGTDTGGIYLGAGTNTVTLGNDGEAVFGGGYADTITGGAGNDFISIARGNNIIDGGGGFNILSFADADMGVTVDLGAGTATVGAAGAEGSDTIRNIQEVIGSAFADTLKAGAGAAELVGGAGHDTLIGGAGNDTLVAGTGGATMTGGGGNNSFVFSQGDHQVVITDFDTGADADVLNIYGYGAALSVAQQGADTLITLSASDSVLLKNVVATSLGTTHLVYHAGSFATAPQEPADAGVFGTKPIAFTSDLTVAAGEVLNEANNPIALRDDTLSASGLQLHAFDNKGTVNVSTNTGDVTGLFTDNSAYSFNGVAFTYEAGALFSVVDTSAAGTAYGFQTGSATPLITNAGTITVRANGTAYGASLGSDVQPFTNAAGGIIEAQSATAGAYGLLFTDSCKLTNNGQISATGVTGVYGVMVTQADFATFINNGSITATATGIGGTSYGIDLQLFPSGFTITNAGTITAAVAITMPDVNWAAPLTVTNSGTITGTMALQVGGVAETINNSGHIVGAIHFGDGADAYNGPGGTQSGGIYLGAGTNTATLGNDGETVFGGGGTDTITGGAGNDVFEIGRGQGSIDGGGGFNTLSLADADMAVTVNLGTGQLTFAGAYTVKNVNEVIGSAYNDTLIAGASAATLIAGSGHATLVGGAGNDTLAAGTGGDVMTGGGGNNSFIYSSGDKQLIITDFGANGDGDVLDIDGYTSAQSIVQQGANTLIQLSASDSILLDNVAATSLTGGKLVYNATPYQPVEPAALPTYLSSQAPINALYAMTTYAGETRNIVSHTSDLNINQNIALWSSNGDDFANFGTININSADDGLQGVDIGQGPVPNANLTSTNAAGAHINVTDSDGSAMGVSFGGQASNAGAITVNAQTSAVGVGGNEASLDNSATGVITATSQTSDATGVTLGFGPLLTNEGLISATGVTAATGIAWDTYYLTPLVNNGTITATARGANALSYGINVIGYYNEDAPSYIVNYGTITASIAINETTLAGGTGFAPLQINNQNTINGDIDLQGSDSTISNAGSINGNINWSTIINSENGTDTFPITAINVTNIGTITGNITLGGNAATVANGGHIIGNIQFGNTANPAADAGPNVYNGAGGTLSGALYLGLATNNVTLGNDGEQAYTSGGTDTIIGGGGNDVVHVAGGQLNFNGGGGTNTAIYTGVLANYRITKTAGSPSTFTVTDLRTGSPDGTDTFTNTQFLQFADVTLNLSAPSLSLTGGGQVVALWQGLTVNLSATNGLADTVTGSGGTVNLAQADATINGNDNSIASTGSGAVISVLGAGDTLQANGTGDAITISDNGQTGSVDTVAVGTNGHVTALANTALIVNANGANVSTGVGDNLGLFGANDTANLGAGDGVWVGLNGQLGGIDTLNFTGSGYASVASNSAVIVNGSGVYVSAGAADNLGLFGANDTLALSGAGDGVWVGGNGQTGGIDTLNFAQGGGVSVASNSAVIVNGSGVYVAGGQSDNLGLFGANDTLALSGAGDGVWVGGNGQTGGIDTLNFAQGGGVSVGAQANVTVNGSGVFVSTSQYDDVALNGANDTIMLSSGLRNEVISGFQASGAGHDSLQMAPNIFADWAHLLGATKQQGSDLVITLDASDTVVLKNIALASFTSADAKFM